MTPSNMIPIYGALILVQVIFGVNFVASKIIVTSVDPVHWSWFRFLVAGAILFAFITLRKVKNPLNRKFFITASILGFIGFTLGQISFLKGIKLTTTVNTSIICSTIPIFTLIIVIIRKIEKLTVIKLVGFVASFLGVLVLKKVEDFSFNNATFVGDMLIFFSAFSTAVYISYSKSFLRSNNHLVASTWIFLLASFQMILFAGIDGAPLTVPPITTPLGVSMVFSVIGATFVTYYLSNWALVHVDAAKVSIFIYLQPVIASLFAWLYLGEVVTVRVFLSCSLIICGFLLALYGGRKKLTVDSRDGLNCEQLH